MSEKYASLKLAVNHNELKLVKDIMATERTIQGLVVNFDFRTPEWKVLTKTAVFIRDGKSYTVLLDGADECFIPWECLKASPPPSRRARTLCVWVADCLSAAPNKQRIKKFHIKQKGTKEDEHFQQEAEGR